MNPVKMNAILFVLVINNGNHVHVVVISKSADMEKTAIGVHGQRSYYEVISGVLNNWKKSPRF
jgi:hypothetical protein